MHFTTQSSLLPQAAVVVGIFQDDGFDPAGKLLDQRSGGALASLKARGMFSGKPDETQWLYDVPGIETSVLIIGLGKSQRFDADAYIKALKAAGRALLKAPFSSVSLGLTTTPIQGNKGTYSSLWALEQAVLQLNYMDYRFERFKSEAAPASKLESVALLTSENEEATSRVITQAIALANGIRLARELVNLPANVATPSYLANEARGLGKQFARIETTVLDHAQCEALGMGSFLSVSRGGEEPAQFIILNYKGAADDVAPTVLVGKGITFDTGGISIKPAADMHEMKMDMGGAASVLGAFRTLGEFEPAVNVVGLVPTCENMPSATATKPGDVVKSMSGKTIEVLNTDAEGRLILADALTYAERYNPKAVIDIATLTGACIVALGTDVAALYSDDEDLAQALLASSERTRDHIWRMPLVKKYLEPLKKGCADLSNISPGGGRSAGSIIAACFLQEFTEAYPWAHLDIAGVAMQPGKDFMGTGRPVSLLVDYLLTKTS